MGSPARTYSFPDRRHLDALEEANNGYHHNLDFEVNNLSNQIEITIVKDRLSGLEARLQREMETLNSELEDLRAGHYMLDDEKDDLLEQLNILTNKNAHLAAEVLSFKKLVQSCFKSAIFMVIFGIGIGAGFGFLDVGK